MTQDRRASAREAEDLDVGGFGLGLDADEGPDPSDAFATRPSRQAAPVRPAASARPLPAQMPEPDDLPEIDGDPFGGPPPFEPPVRSDPPAPGHRPDPGDWASMQEIGGPAPRGAGFGGGDPDGDPAEEFANFGGARSVASLGRHAEEPEPKGSYRAEAADHDDVVVPFGDDEDEGEIPKGSLYREDEAYEEGDGQEGDPSLTMDDESDPEEDADEQEPKPSLVDRLKRFALPAAAAAAIGGGGYVGWTLLSPMLSAGDVAPIQTAAPIVPKQPVAGLPAFPPTAQAQQRPTLPGAAATLPALPGQQPVSVSELPGQPRPAGLPQSSALPQAPTPQLPAAQIQPQPFPAAQLPQAQVVQAAAVQPAPSGFAPTEPYRPAAAPAPSLGGGLNGRTAPPADIEAKLAAIAADVAALRGRQDEAARSSQSERDDLRSRMGDLERRLGETRRPQASVPDRDETKPRRAERPERVERDAPTDRPGRLDRRGESRAVYREASADDGTPPPKPKVVQGFSLKGVSRGIASVEGRGGVVEVGVGQVIPGAGEVKAIRRYGSDWVVVVGKGVIVQQ